MEVFKDELSYTNQIRQMAIERLCLPLLEHTNSNTLEEFFVAHIRSLVDCVEEKYNKYVDEEYQKQIINKTCAFKGLWFSPLVTTNRSRASYGKDLTISARGHKILFPPITDLHQ